jgi:uncharacterized protein (DUF2225 family)
MGMSVVAKGDDRLEKMAIRPFSMCPRSGESIFASAMIDWRRIRKNSSISEELIRAKLEEKKNSQEFFDIRRINQSEIRGRTVKTILSESFLQPAHKGSLPQKSVE